MDAVIALFEHSESAIIPQWRRYDRSFRAWIAGRPQICGGSYEDINSSRLRWTWSNERLTSKVVQVLLPVGSRSASSYKRISPQMLVQCSGILIYPTSCRGPLGLFFFLNRTVCVPRNKRREDTNFSWYQSHVCR